MITVICVLLGNFSAVIGAEYNLSFTFPNSEDNLNQIILTFSPESATVTICRYISSSLTIVLLICIFAHYLIMLQINKYKLMCKIEDNLYTTGYMKYLILELVLNFIHTPPFLDGYWNIPQRTATQDAQINIDCILTIILLFARSYQLLKISAFHSKWYNYKTEKICHECNTPLNYMFSIKAEFKENPFRLVLLCLLGSIFIFGYAIRSIEMFFMNGGENPLDWRYFWNGMWCVIITMATVGFGDFYPISTIGRALIVIACFWGTFLISLMVAALSMSIEFNMQESISYQSIKADEFEIEYGITCTKLIQTGMRYYWHCKKATNENYESDELFRQIKSKLYLKLKNYIELFRQLRKNKDEKLQSLLIDMSLSKIDNNLTYELDKIKDQIYCVETVKNMLEEYNKNQKIIKEKALELFHEMEEINNFRQRFLRENE